MTPFSGTDFICNLPGEPTAERERLILEAISAFNFVLEWSAVRSVAGGHTAIIYVSSDALRVGSMGDCVRVNVTHAGAQHAADILDVALPTTKISDLIHEQASVKISPCTQTPDATMGWTSRMQTHSRAVDTKISGVGGLVSSVGKDWVLTNQLVGHADKAANYGWHCEHSQFRGPGGIPVFQPLGLAHNLGHVDYSQVLRLVKKTMMVDGAEVLLADVLTSAELSGLVSYEGPLKITRHPGVPLETANA